MNNPSVSGPHRPRNINEIVEMALNFQFKTTINFKHWTRATETLWQEAQFAIRDGDLRRAFMMLYRHSNLVVEQLPTHPEFKLPESKKLYKPLAARLPQAMQMMEDLKPEIMREYEEWEAMAQSQKASQQHVAVADQTSRPSTYAHFAARDPSLSGNAKILDAADHQELAVDLAQKEFRRRDAAKRATRQAGISEEEERDRRKAGSWDGWTVPQRNGDYIPIEDADFRLQMEAARRQLTADEQRNDETNRLITDADQQNAYRYSGMPPPNYSYPTIHKSRPIQYDTTSVYEARLPPLQPPKPPKERFSYDREVRHDFAPPPIPGKEPPPYQRVSIAEQRFPSELPALPPKEELRPREVASPTKPPPRLTFKPAAYLENGEPIRPIFLPSGLRSAFLKVAQDNTNKGLEMCGILCGTPVNNALFIKCLLIPEQKCTSDTCETENESAMLDFCINEDLLVLGWIHTHPTQTCFMSSRDLHTQAGYQVMMPESIAIVCAPKFNPSYGIFRLTNPPGLPHILQCFHTDTFHQHSIDNIYTECGHPPGHVYETNKMDFQVVDLRPELKR